MAIEARDMVVQGDAVANLPPQTRDPRPQLRNYAGGFVSEDARWRHGAMLDLFDVGGADATHGDLDEQFVGADAGDGDGFEAQVVNAAIDDGAHGFGDVRHANFFTRIARIITNLISYSRQSAVFASQKPANHGSGSQENSIGWLRQAKRTAQACGA
jgi:hypothetical protein